jgi:DNA processing protein
VPYPSPRYPTLLRPIADPPPLLLVRGSVEVLQRPAVAIVGARAATRYGLGVARDLAAGLARNGVVVISGLARGIDAAAHAGALEAGGVTVAVQACGPDITYPPEHRALADRIATSGAVVSELPPGRAPLAAHFPLRNRLISGLSLGVVVVEARPRSGSLITARHALDQGREVLAVPGPLTAPTSSGPNSLLRDGARPVIELADILAAVGLDSVQIRPGPARMSGSETSSPGEERILALLQELPCTPDELLRALELSPRELASRLLGLQLDGRVVEDRDGRLRVVSRGAV